MVRQLTIQEQKDIAKILDLDKYKPVKESDKNLVQIYFNNELTDDFLQLNDGFVRIVSFDVRVGYTFAYELQLNRNHENRMEKELKRHRIEGLHITRKFVNYKGGISGFSWERK